MTDFANAGGSNVLLVRVDATQSDGWFYEGAGIYRHVWLVKTSPVHMPRWGTFVKADVGGGAAGLAIRTEVAQSRQEPAESARGFDSARSVGRDRGHAPQARRHRFPTETTTPSSRRST